MIGFTDEEWAKLQKSKDAEVQKLVSMWEQVFKNPAYDNYVSFKIQVDKWNQETREKPASIKGVDGSANKDFEYSLKYLTELPDFTKKLKELQDLLTPEELKAAKEQIIEHQGGLESFTHDLYAKERAK